MALSKAFEKKNVLVTGGAGFIGSHLCERLIHENAQVICIDNFMNSKPINIEHILGIQDFVFINADVTAPLELASYRELERFNIRFQGVQEIYHLACPTSATQFNDYKIQTLHTTTDGTRNVLDLAVKFQSKVVFASSSVVYGPRTASKAQFAEYDLGLVDHLGQRACYDEGKKFGETMCATYRDVYRVDAKMARIFRTYGPRLKLNDGQMINDFVVSALKGEDLIIYGDKDFKTSLTFVTDIVDGLIKLMAAPDGTGAVNLGTDYEFTMVEVAERILKLMKSTARVRFEDPLAFMTELGLPNLSKAKDVMGWFPLTTLDEGLRQTIDYTIANQGRLGLV